MGEAKTKEQNCVFGVSYQGQAGDPDRIPVMVIGVPQGAWAYMSDGKTHTFDLTPVGVPVKIMMFGARTRAECTELIKSANEANGRRTLDATETTDFGMKPIEGGGVYYAGIGNQPAPLEYPADLTPALAYVLGLHPGEAIQIVGALRECGQVIEPRYEAENAAVRHFLIPIVLKHGDDWREAALETLERMKGSKA